MVNNVVLVGRITKDPEVRNTGSTSVCNFSLAVNRNFKNKEGGYDADFVNVVVFGNIAELMERYVSKGQLISVQGRIQTRNYENSEGQRIYVTEVVGTTVQFLESKNKSSESNQSSPYDFAEGFNSKDLNDATSIDDDDLPF